MYTSPKRMMLTNEGKVVEAGPGVSGTLIVAEGSQITEDEARKYGLLPPAADMPKQKPMVAPIIVRGPEGEITLGQGKVELDPNKSTTGSDPGAKPEASSQAHPSPQTVGAESKPWEASQGSTGSLDDASNPIQGDAAALKLGE